MSRRSTLLEAPQTLNEPGWYFWVHQGRTNNVEHTIYGQKRREEKALMKWIAEPSEALRRVVVDIGVRAYCQDLYTLGHCL